MNEFVKTLLELLICFFACIGIVTLLRELYLSITIHKTKTQATAILDLTLCLSPIDELISFATFYNDSYASRYISKIIVITNCDDILSHTVELSQALKIPLIFKKTTNEEKEGYDDRKLKRTE
ncbi:MAG: hypothetical protein IKV53_02525 [Clostridia bacterium]|nr:hypothetical protein [Clostridia bacterium]